MKLIKKHPSTPSLRHTVLIQDDNLKKGSNPIKSKTVFFKNFAGRNNKGRITVFTKGGGHKKRYRIIDFNRLGLNGIVEHVEYDPNRTARIARIFSLDNKTHSYILASEGLKRGNTINDFSNRSKNDTPLKIGSIYTLNALPLGTYIHNLQFSNKSSSGIARSAGTFAQIVSKDERFCRVRLMSGEERLFPLTAVATLGTVSNSLHKFKVLGKAGRSRWLGRRPSVRGVAMNPIDHPHGGGEGKTSGGRPSVTPWGKVAKGQPTRKKKFNNKLIIKNG